VYVEAAALHIRSASAHTCQSVNSKTSQYYTLVTTAALLAMHRVHLLLYAYGRSLRFT
jgi:hypothetical protein